MEYQGPGQEGDWGAWIGDSVDRSTQLCEACGNGQNESAWSTTEECDDSNGVKDDICNNACELNECGDGLHNNFTYVPQDGDWDIVGGAFDTTTPGSLIMTARVGSWGANGARIKAIGANQDFDLTFKSVSYTHLTLPTICSV